MYEDGIDGDSLMEVVARSVKHIDVGAAVLPKPLFKKDIDEKLLESDDDDDDDDDKLRNSQIDLLTGVDDDGGHSASNVNVNGDGYKPPIDTTREGRAPEYYDISPRIPTRYAKTLRREFNAVGTLV
jgi:hypothetical protein